MPLSITGLITGLIVVVSYTSSRPQVRLTTLHLIAYPLTMSDFIIDPTDGVQLARPAHAAQLLSVSPRTIYNWIADGKLRVRYAVGGAVLVEVKSLFTSERPANARVGWRWESVDDDQPAA